MKGYNKIKDAMIAILTAVVYRNICITSNSDTFAITFGAVCTFGCVYYLMREIDEWSERKHRKEKEHERSI